MSGLAFAALVLCLHITAGESQQFTTIVEHSEINVAVGGTSPASSPQTSATVNLRATGESQQFTTIVEHSEINVAVGGTSPASSPQTSATVILRVTDPVAVTGVTVVTNDSAPLENLDTIALSCDASGAVQTRTWFKDDQPIQENGRIFTSPDRAKLTIIGVNRNDAGTYKCIASNSISSGTGETYVQVYYGTEKVRIVPERPVVSNIVSNLTLTCFALSVPWGIYAWYNGNNLLQTGQELTLVSMSSVNVGSYTCRVTNDVTKRSSNLTVHVTAQGE
ncbi:carcinoembryonic antigen-related cell adhesion molecule 5-like [Hypanus sabinus]|uniref:carcinoembryonic antigen-related cell adhesion molecule 5-like n=1 Tax=Hypanus sabinus TaxID=79690 RepID=UPI0028C4595F|nr:carcinoembryonic antigen-related cell adhesion molecule 5-like [Hypanus sabinus]